MNTNNLELVKRAVNAQMTEIDINKFKDELEKTEEGFYFKEIKRVVSKNGQRKDVMGKTQDRFKFDVIIGHDGGSF